MRFVVPLVFAVPQKFKRTVGPRLGLLGFYRGGAFIAIGFHRVKFGFLGDDGDRRDQGGSARSMGLQNRLTKAVDRNAIRRKR
jgi:hypothetical protein